MNIGVYRSLTVEREVKRKRNWSADIIICFEFSTNQKSYNSKLFSNLELVQLGDYLEIVIVSNNTFYTMPFFPELWLFCCFDRCY